MTDNRPTLEQLAAIAEDYGGFCKACGAEELIMQGWCR